MTILDAVRDYIGTFPGLAEDAELWVNFIGILAPQYSIVPLPAEKILDTYLNGKTVRQFQFAFQSLEVTIDDVNRLANSGFYEALEEWLEGQTVAGVLPTLATGKVATDIEALTSGILFAQGGQESTTGIYQVQCRLIYEQVPVEPTPEEEPEEEP